MNTLYIYATLAIAFLIVVVALLRNPRAQDGDAVEKKEYASTVGSRRWLDLSERIFDPSDVRWLEQELAFPKLARALSLDRKRLAVQWLEALQSSFDELIRTPEAVSGDNGPSHASGWSMLWLILRFKFLISYALVVVKLLGPYHPLIPSFAWLPFSRGLGQKIRLEALAGNRTSS
jgi:hypothetical protein